MRSRLSVRLLLATSLMAATPGAVLAQAISPTVEAMIRQAATSSNDAMDAVAAAAKAVNPAEAGAIDALVGEIKAAQTAQAEAEMKRASFFDNWSGEGQIGLSRTSGNTSDTGFLVAVGLSRDGLKTRQFFNAALDRQKSDGTLTRERMGANYELNYKFNDRFYAFGLIGWERDKFAGFSRRFTESGGLGYRVLDAETMTLDVEAGPAFRQVKFVDGTSDSQISGRGSLAYRWQILDNLAFSEDAAVYLGDSSTLTSSTALSAAITGALSARLSFDVTHESDPPEGNKKTDTASRFSVVYGF